MQNLLINKLFPIYSAITALAVFVQGFAYDELVVWAFRGFISLCLAIIAYLLKKMYEEYRASMIQRDERIRQLEIKYEGLIKICAAHEVMYEYWLETLVDSSIEGGQRKTDKIHALILKLAERGSL